MKRLSTIVAIMMAFVCALNVSAKDDPMQYEVEAAGVGSEGTYLVRAWVISSKGKTTDAQIKEAALRGVIFRGFAAGNGSSSQRPMVSPALEQEKAPFFNDFFAGAAGSFASIVTGSQQRVKTAKGTKTGAVVQVRKDELRRYLEQAGVARGLSSGF